FCSHRVELSLEPSCVVVCPTQSIIAGDLDDPTSKISQMMSRHDTKVRAPEQGTKPHVFYKGADEAALDPLRTKIADDGMIWADTTEHHPSIAVSTESIDSNLVARTAYTTNHPMAWKGKVSAYLVTKGVAGGAFMVAGLAALMGHHEEQAFIGVYTPVIALAFAAITGVLLIADLKQPLRFFYIFTRPQWGSWLVKGAFILAGLGGLGSLWFLAGVTNSSDVVRWLAVPTIVFGAGTAGYTAWLFAQCEGRDLWQTPLMLPVLLAQAVTAGASALIIPISLFDVDAGLESLVLWSLFGGVVAQLVLVAIEVTSHATVSVEVATAMMTKGKYRGRFWTGVVVGMVAAGGVALAAALADNTTIGAIAAVLALVGLAAYEDAFVRAGQSVPLS
ncbi:MAG: NrfD/PsrC family molybdoenzyme membrane anchor subunit, partial [Ilumatobacteraceae bacterium]